MDAMDSGKREMIATVQPNLAFDYQLHEIQQADAETLEESAERIVETQGYSRRVSSEEVVQVGKELIEAQTRLARYKNGTFQRWVKERLQMTPKSAYNAINAANEFGYCENFSQYIAPSAMYAIAADTCPDEAKAEAKALAEAGERITHKRAKEIIEKYIPDDDTTLEHADDDDPAPFNPQAFIGDLNEVLEKAYRTWPEDQWPSFLRIIESKLEAYKKSGPFRREAT